MRLHKMLVGSAAVGSVMLLGCSKTVVSPTDLSEYASFDLLPKCSVNNDGDRAFVEDESLVYLCDAGQWVPLNSDGEIIRDTIAVCGKVSYLVSEKICLNDKILLPICDDRKEGKREVSSEGQSYTCYKGRWNKTSPIELELGLSCSDKNDKEVVKYQYSNYVCRADSIGWVYDFDNIIFDSLEYGDKVYKTVGMGSQMWMAENLSYADTAKLPNLKNGVSCYNKETRYCESYGALYTWTAAMDLPAALKDSIVGDRLKKVHRGICPEGWHIPSHDDFEVLKTFVDDNNAEEDVGISLKSVEKWQDAAGYQGVDRFGFNILAAGNNDPAGRGSNLGVASILVVADEMSCTYDYMDKGVCLTDKETGLSSTPVRVDFRYDQSAMRYLQSEAHSRSSYMSVRCVMDGK